MTAFTADHPILPLTDQIALARRWFSRALLLGCSRSAFRWLRVVEGLVARRDRLAAAQPAASPAQPSAGGPESPESKNFDRPRRTPFGRCKTAPGLRPSPAATARAPP